MNAKELRLGNLIKLGDVIATVSVVEDHKHTSSINEVNQDMINGVEINNKWLGNLPQLEDWFIILIDNKDGSGYNCFLKKDSFYIVRIKYIHQLQNLFFDTKGEELELR